MYVHYLNQISPLNVIQFGPTVKRYRRMGEGWDKTGHVCSGGETHRANCCADVKLNIVGLVAWYSGVVALL